MGKEMVFFIGYRIVFRKKILGRVGSWYSFKYSLEMGGVFLRLYRVWLSLGVLYCFGVLLFWLSIRGIVIG